MYYVAESDGNIMTKEQYKRQDMFQYCTEAKDLIEAINIALDIKANDRFVEISNDYYESEIAKLKKEIKLLKERNNDTE